MGDDLSKLSNDDLIKRVEWYESKYGPYISERGLHNFKNLFRKPNSYEWVILFMLVMTLVSAWAYVQETEQSRETLANLPTICIELQSQQSNSYLTNPNALTLNLTEVQTVGS